MRYPIVIALLAAGIFCGHAQQTRVLTADKHNEYGLVYTLPTTALRIEVTAIRSVMKAGPYWQYAKKYIGTDKVIRNDGEQWTISEVHVTPYGVPDSENRYLMQLKPGALTYISVGDDNMLLSINREVAVPAPLESGEVRKSGSAMSMDAYLEYVDEDFISSQSSAKQAQMLAQNLMEVRDAKVSLTRGTAETMPTDGRQLELMLASLRRQENAFTSAFTGITRNDTIVRTYTLVPDQEGKQVLFRMSDFAGFVESDDYSGDPVYAQVQITDEGELPVDAKGETKRLPKDAVMYCIPGKARVTISLKGETLWSGENEYSQYGVKFGLQPSLFSDRRSRSFAIFDTATGALQELGEMNE